MMGGRKRAKNLSARDWPDPALFFFWIHSGSMMDLTNIEDLLGDGEIACDSSARFVLIVIYTALVNTFWM